MMLKRRNSNQNFNLSEEKKPKVEKNQIPKCYVCSKNITDSGATILVNANLPFSKISIAQTIGKLMGKYCMVLVSEEDFLCNQCTELFNELDRLESELSKVTQNIIEHLMTRYDISRTSISPLPPEVEYVNNDLEQIEKQLSDMYGVSVTVTKSSDNLEKSGVKKHNFERNYFPFKCPLCRKGFNDKDQLRDHVTNSHLSQYKCAKCQVSFQDEQILKKHMETDCNRLKSVQLQNKFKCAICSKKFEKKELLNLHLRKHKTAYFKCGSCGETFQKRDILMKHLQLHINKKDSSDINQVNTQNITVTTPPAPVNLITSEIIKSGREIKFIDCKSCSLSFIDSEHYSAHINSVHNKQKLNTESKIIKEEKLDALNQIDLETIFEKLHSDGGETKEIQSNVETSTLSNQESVLVDLLSENFDSPTETLPNCSKNITLDTYNKVYLYKCPGCTTLYDNSSDLESHIFSTGHVDLASEIQIIEVENTENIIDNDSVSKILTNNNELSFLSLPEKENSINVNTNAEETFLQNQNNSEIKIMSLETSNSNNLDFIASQDGDEIKLLTFHDSNEIQLLPSNDDEAANQYIDLNSDSVSNANLYNLNTTDILATDQTSTHKDIEKLIESVVDEESQTSVAPAAAPILDRSKVQILDEKTINISHFINTNKDDLNGQIFQLNNFCAMNVKHENQSTNQITSNTMELLSSTASNTTNNVTNIKPTSSGGLKENNLNLISQKKIYKCCRCNFKCLEHDRIKAHITKHKKDEVIPLTDTLPLTSDQETLITLTTDNDNNDNLELQQPTSDIVASGGQGEMMVPATSQTGIINTTFHDQLNCKLCKQKFKSIQLFKRHNNTFHREPICVYCNKQMKSLQALRVHEQRHLYAGDLCVCDDCGKQFKTKCGLNNHRAIHTGNYNLFCEYCNRGFMSKVVLEEHRRKHTKEERFICDICGKRFQFKGTYWIHRKWHDNPYPYKCNFCNRKFRHTSLLAVHRRKHTGERPYQCPHCKQTFSVSGTLKNHLSLHTGVYAFTCNVCQRGFTSKYKYGIHLSKVHGDSSLRFNTPKVIDNNFKMVVKENCHENIQENQVAQTIWANRKDLEVHESNFGNIMEINLFQN